METHVTGQPALGELRQALLAVVLGNPLFSAAEQLQANHAAHECADPAYLIQWTHAQRHEAARRTRVAALRQQVAQEAICYDVAAQRAEMQRLMAVRSPLRDTAVQRRYLHLVGVSDPAFGVRVLGEAYLGLLERAGFMRGILN